jgi:hypothetical protein
LPDVVEVHFGYGDVEFAAEAVLKASENLALVLKRVGVWEPEFESEEAYGHSEEKYKSLSVQKYKRGSRNSRI